MSWVSISSLFVLCVWATMFKTFIIQERRICQVWIIQKTQINILSMLASLSSWNKNLSFSHFPSVIQARDWFRKEFSFYFFVCLSFMALDVILTEKDSCWLFSSLFMMRIAVVIRQKWTGSRDMSISWVVPRWVSSISRDKTESPWLLREKNGQLDGTMNFSRSYVRVPRLTIESSVPSDRPFSPTPVFGLWLARCPSLFEIFYSLVFQQLSVVRSAENFISRIVVFFFVRQESLQVTFNNNPCSWFQLLVNRISLTSFRRFYHLELYTVSATTQQSFNKDDALLNHNRIYDKRSSWQKQVFIKISAPFQP